MFYRIKDARLYDYADYKYAEDCLELIGFTMADYAEDSNRFCIKNNTLILNPDYQQYLYDEKKRIFETNFFKTSLGWIRRNVKMQDGSQKDFLSDLLPSIKLGVELNNTVNIITYNTPDFNNELTNDYIISLQNTKAVNLGFIQECLMQVMKDFGG